MFEIIGNMLINSDWHLNHKNIWIYEFEKRKVFINKEKYPNINSKNDLEDFYDKNILDKREDLNIEFYLDTEYNMLLRIKSNLENILKEYSIKEYINLGDFIFNISDSKIEMYSQTKNYQLLLEIFDILKKYKVHNTLFLGNHDKKDFALFYYIFFDKIKEYEFNQGILISHYPFNQDNKFFKNLDNLEQIKKNIKLSIHGHTHGNIAKESKDIIYSDIQYINMSIESFI